MKIVQTFDFLMLIAEPAPLPIPGDPHRKPGRADRIQPGHDVGQHRIRHPAGVIKQSAKSAATGRQCQQQCGEFNQ